MGETRLRADVDRQRCGEPTQRGTPCRNYAVEDGRCRLHARRARDADAGASGDGHGAGHAGAPPRRRPRTTPAQAFTSAPPPSREGTELIDALSQALGNGLGDHLAEVADFLRRRFTGDYEIDEFGLDPDLLVHVLYPLLGPLYDRWWRVTSHGREHLPDGGGLLVANHAGTLPADGLMLGLDVHRVTGRFVRELGADLVFQTPVVGHLARKGGIVRASHDDADAVLARGELAAVFPEGYKGLGKPFSQRYQLERFGRGGFVATALRARVPIVPVAIVGSEEIYPLLWDARLIARALGLPYFPIVAQMLALPVLGPVGLLPLPSKWSISYGEPIDTAALPARAAEDPMVIFDLADQVRERIQDMLLKTVMGRQSVFF